MATGANSEKPYMFDPYKSLAHTKAMTNEKDRNAGMESAMVAIVFALALIVSIAILAKTAHATEIIASMEDTGNDYENFGGSYLKGQSFSISSCFSITEIDWYGGQGNGDVPTSYGVSISTGDFPEESTLGSNTANVSSFVAPYASPDWNVMTMSDPVELTNIDALYYITIYGVDGGSGTDQFRWEALSTGTYTGGTAWQYTGTWSGATGSRDNLFRVIGDPITEGEGCDGGEEPPPPSDTDPCMVAFGTTTCAYVIHNDPIADLFYGIIVFYLTAWGMISFFRRR